MTKARDLANAGTALTSVSATELGYLDGVTSAVQTQINSKIGQATAINPTIVDAKGDIVAATAADTVARLAVGANDTVLTADSSTATGLKWAAPASSSGPAFFAKRITSQQGISSGVGTKIQFNSEDFDTDSCYDPTTNYRFTANKAGYYQFNCSALMTGGSMTAGDINLRKNGTTFASGNFVPPNSGYVGVVCSAIVYLNGSTDYVEAFATNYGGGNIETGTGTVFNGVWIRS